MSVSLFLGFVKKHRLDIAPVKSERATTTAKEAAEAHGVPVSSIVKSLLVREADGEFVLYLCPGDKRLELSEGARMANADEVKEVTGHSIGGVPPYGHKRTLKTVIVDGFDPNAPLWAAAGAADTNFKTGLKMLQKVVRLLDRPTICDNIKSR